MDLKELKELISLMDDAKLSEIELEEDGRRIRLKKASAEPIVIAPIAAGQNETVANTASQAAASEKNNALHHQVTSPIVGTFYTAASPNTDPYIALGDLVKKGQVICIVEAMKLMNEIESDIDGRIVKTCVEDGAAVEYGEALFLIEPA
ncbi:MAG: acetyl-CoA carboxylase biotin carboxyl carrier protein [Nitrospirae bacterium]|nr:acetyl-CoA carboxylase biotin carboxyl carrier protein [Candidatus Manganitrophaceae bacterium]